MLHRCKLFLSLGVATLVGMTATMSAAQECVRIEATPAGASLMLRGDRQYAAAAPASFCNLRPGQSYRLTVAFPGHETRNLSIKLKDDGTLSKSGTWFGPSARSTVVPGWGQFSTGNNARATWALGIGLGTVAYGTWAWVIYDDAKDRYNTALDLTESTTNQAQLEAIEHELRGLAQEANVNRQRFEDIMIAGAYFHANNIFEAFLLSRPPKSSIEGSTLTLSTSELKNRRAAMRSFLFPGFGQKYMGRHLKGWFMQSFFITATVLAIEWRADTQTAKNAYDNHLIMIDRATTADEIARLRVEAAPLWDEYKDRERWRDVFYISMGATWAWSFIDAAFISSPETLGGKIGFETSLNGSSPEMSLTWRF